MNRDKLLNSICPMSRVYDCCIADGDYDCDNCKRLTKEWFNEYDKQIRADAIDEFVHKIKECVGMDWEWDFMFIEQIAEQLKEQKK